MISKIKKEFKRRETDGGERERFDKNIDIKKVRVCMCNK